ncbi:bacillithiol biosynthesis deacetylase BshB2 [Salicibibacter cibarius]|uniref:Bacillithiol biosynthesis deacetylase BshB2 n=1 Tax=Salicibibacter cibarius TaxID=2743000 RepID=A0A7T7CAK0_9BACI|nr:bacillithiol biosynthesis deacetylase BshB2 [Salicibibacter cibarius]QQK74943.1 bacillithiol biosynthesis deacetylase BshB2 [Salicibibacter cibarius]
MVKKERHVLVIFPHPDDEAFGVSGTISAHIANGTPVTYACLTLGEMGRNVGNPPIATRESLPDVRKKELEEAADAMGLTDLRMMGYRDKTLEFLAPGVLKGMVEELVAELNPTLVISFYPEHSVHPDHNATAAAVVEALADMPKETRPTLYAVAITLDNPDVVYSVKDYMREKLLALRAHHSQFGATFAEREKHYRDGDPEIAERLENERFFDYKFADDA